MRESHCFYGAHTDPRPKAKGSEHADGNAGYYPAKWTKLHMPEENSGEMDGGGDSALSRGAGNELKENPPLYGREGEIGCPNSI